MPEEIAIRLKAKLAKYPAEQLDDYLISVLVDEAIREARFSAKCYEDFAKKKNGGARDE